jgi:hypothetical protein
MTETARPPVTMTDLPGIWRRGVLVTSDGRRDETSDVYWLQGLTLYGDMRREGSVGATRMTAFAGRLSERDGVFRWERTIAAPPPDGPPDDGRLSWQSRSARGDVLRENGVHDAYWETWRRVAPPTPADFAAELFEPTTARRGYLLAMGGLTFFGVSATPDGGGAAFLLRGVTPDGDAIALSTGSSGWTAEMSIGPPGDAIRITETDSQGAAFARDWHIAALEFPSVPSCGQPSRSSEP